MKLFCSLLLGALACSPAASSQTISAQQLAAKADQYVNPYVGGHNFSGSILIAAKGRTLLEKSYGMANYELGVPNSPHTRFHIASVSKSFTAAAILMLQEQGLLTVNDPISRFIPDYPNGGNITIHQLLTHTSGIPNVNNFADYQERSRERLTLPQIIHIFRHRPLDFLPGDHFSYSNSNYNLLAFIIEKVSGQKYGDYLKQKIFDPLGMDATGNDDGSDRIIPDRASGYVPVGMDDIENAPYLNWSIKTGNGSLYSTVEDLYKWDQALYTGKLLGPRSREKMFTDYGGFGYGWFVRKQFGRRITVINGRSPGFTSSLARFIDENVSIILVANTYSGLTQSMADDLAAMVFNEKYEVMSPGVRLSSARLASFVGHYRFGQDFTYNPGGEVLVESDGQALRIVSGETTSYLIPQSDNSFRDRLYGGKLTFESSHGKVDRLKWNFGREFVAQRQPSP